MARQRGQQAAASAGRARHTFHLPKLGGKLEPFSLLSGRASGRQTVGPQGRRGRPAEMLGERRNQAWRGSSQAEARPLAAARDPALGGSASTRHRRPPANRWCISRSLSSRQRSRLPRQHRPGPTPHAQPAPTGSAGQPFPPEERGGWLACSGDDAPSNTTSPGCFSEFMTPRRHDLQKHHDSTGSHSSGLRI